MKKLLPLLLLVISFQNLHAQRFEWLEIYSSSGFSSSLDAVTEVKGNNVIVAGEFQGTISFGSTVLNGGSASRSIYVANFDTLGNFRWAVKGGSTTGFSDFRDLDIDQYGNIYVIGTYAISCTWGSLTLSTSGGGSTFSSEGFIVKLNSQGVSQWIRGIYTPGNFFNSNSLIEISVADSSVYFGGTLTRTIAVTGSNLQLVQTTFANNAYIARMDLSGNLNLLQRIVNTSQGTSLNYGDIEAINDSTFYFSGLFRGVFTFGSNNRSLNTANLFSAVLLRFTNSTCDFVAPSTSSSTSFSFRPPQIEVTNDFVYMSGLFSNNLTFQTKSITAIGATTFSNFWFAAKFDLIGGIQELVNVGVESTNIFDIAHTDKNEVVIVGSFADSLQLNGNTVFSNGSTDMLIVNLDSSLNFNWLQVGGGGNSDNAYSVASDNSSNVYVLGDFRGLSQFGSTFFTGNNAFSTSILMKLSECGNNPVPLSFSGDTNFCAGQNLRIQANFPTFSTFQWLKDSIQLSGEIFRDLIIDSTGNYQVIVNGQGCVDTSRAVQVNVGTPPIVVLSLNDTVCEQDAPIILSGGTPLGGVYKGPGVVNNTFDPSLVSIGNSPITYVFSNGGCRDSATANIFVKPAPTVFFAPIPNLCITASPITLTNAFPFGGVFSGNGVSGGQFDPAAAGGGFHTITYTYTDRNGCFGIATQTIEVDTLPITNLASLPTLCNNSGVYTLTEGSPSGGVYQGIGVVNGRFDPSVSGVGTFTIDYTITNQCGSSTSTQTITVNPAPNVSLGAFTDVCEGSGLVTLSGGTPAGGSYSGLGVSGGQFDPITTGVGTFTIFYDFTDAIGCSSRDSSTITVNALPTTTISNDTSICNGSSVSLSATGGTAYLWSNAATTATINVSPTTTTQYFVTVTNASSCTAVEDVTVTVNANPIASISGTTTICEGSSTTLTASGGSTYVWDNTTTNASLTVSPTVSTTYSVTVTDLNGCTDVASQLVTVNPAPNVSLGAFTDVCEGSGLVTLSGGTPAGGSYSGLGVSGGQFDPITTGVGTFTIFYDFTDAIGCSSRDSSTITVNALPTTTISNDTSICNGSSVSLSATGGTTYLWSNAATTATINVSPTTTTQYFVTVTNASSCTAVEDVTVTITQGPLLTSSNDTTICIGDTIVLSAQSNFPNYLWNTNEITSTIRVSPLNSTFYVVSSNNGLGCITRDTINVIVNTGTPINIGPDTTLDPVTTTSFTYDAGVGFTSYLWQDNSTSQTLVVNYDPAKAGITEAISVIVGNSSGCPSVDTAFVFYDLNISLGENISDENGIIIMPNPTTEIINIHFNQNSESSRRVRIFDLRGKLVFDNVYSNYEEIISIDIIETKINKGVYLLNIGMDGENYQEKIIVQ